MEALTEEGAEAEAEAMVAEEDISTTTMGATGTIMAAALEATMGVTARPTMEALALALNPGMDRTITLALLHITSTAFHSITSMVEAEEEAEEVEVEMVAEISMTEKKDPEDGAEEEEEADAVASEAALMGKATWPMSPHACWRTHGST